VEKKKVSLASSAVSWSFWPDWDPPLS